MRLFFLLLCLLISSNLRAQGHLSPEFIPEEDGAAEQWLKSHRLKLLHLGQVLGKMSPTINQAYYDVTHYLIDLTIDPDAKTITGAVTITADITSQGLATAQLDFTTDLSIDSIIAKGLPVGYTHIDDLLEISLPPEMQSGGFQITVYYQGNPVNEGYGTFVFRTVDNLPSVSTLSEPYFARSWWPCKDHPTDKADSVDMIVTIDNRLTVVSNGTKRSVVDNGNGTATTHWHESYPIATYLVSLEIAHYIFESDTFYYQSYEMPLEFYIDPRYKDKPTNNKLVPVMLEYFSDLFGVYPFISEKYGHAQSAFGGGMEHQTISSLGKMTSSYLIAHELSHQWWGDMITCGSWRDIWLNEGFARYCEALWDEHVWGDKVGLLLFFSERIHPQNLVDQIYREDTTDFRNIFDWTVYDKGAYVLHMLRYNVGDSVFFDILRAYANSTHRHGSATTSDFQRLAEEVSGSDLSTFFRQWIYRPGIPTYQYATYLIETDTLPLIHFYLDQVQDEPVFETDIEFRFDAPDTNVTIRVENNLRRQDYEFCLPRIPDSTLLDPFKWIAKEFEQVEYTLRIIDNDLPPVVNNINYDFHLSALAGIPPYSWEVVAGDLPAGITFEDGRLYGHSDSFGSYPLTFRVIDSALPAQSAERSYTLRLQRQQGDFSGEGSLTLQDPILMLRALYLDAPITGDVDAADTDCDGDFDLVDIVLLLNYLYLDGSPPCSLPP